MNPGSATLPFFGVEPVLVDPAEGTVLEGKGIKDALYTATPWPGQARTVRSDHQRFKQTYFSQYPGYYFTGDCPRRAAERSCVASCARSPRESTTVWAIPRPSPTPM